MNMSPLPPTCLPSLTSVADLTDSSWDCLVLVWPSFKYEKNGEKSAAVLNCLPDELRQIVGEAEELDAAAGHTVSLVKVKERTEKNRSEAGG